VPKDQYEEALQLMKKKILENKVPGVTDPEQASDIVKQGDVTYKQACNIAKAGNLDSLWFDVKNQAVVTGCAFGISFVIVYGVGIWQGLKPKEAFKNAFGNALKTGTIVLVSGVGSQQLLRTSFGRTFAAFTTKLSRQLVTKIYSTKVGKEIIERIASTIMKKTLHGAAAKNVVSKFLRTNWVTASVVTIVMSIPEAYNVIVGKNSMVQFGKNSVVNIAGVGGCFGGAALGMAIGGPVGSLIGFLGGLIGGLFAALGIKKLLNLIAPDDSKIMIESMNEAIEELAFDYMITEDDLEKKIIPKIQEVVNAKWLKQMYKYSGGRKNIEKQKQYVREQFEGNFEEILKNKSLVKIPKKINLKWLTFKTKLDMFFKYFYMKYLTFFNKNKNIRTLRKHLGNKIVITDYKNILTEEHEVESRNLLIGELSAVIFTIDCYIIKSSLRVYKINDGVEVLADTLDYIRSLKGNINELPHEKYRIYNEISARHNLCPNGELKLITRATNAINYSWLENIDCICTIKKEKTTSNEQASLFILKRYIGDSFNAEYWDKLDKNGEIIRHKIHPNDDDSYKRKWEI
jgi:hypothetical protein